MYLVMGKINMKDTGINTGIRTFFVNAISDKLFIPSRYDYNYKTFYSYNFSFESKITKKREYFANKNTKHPSTRKNKRYALINRFNLKTKQIRLKKH